MNINDLNKTQIVFLTLFISFVTSVATGIITVTLMEQAPRGVTQTINQVVERTVEKVVTVPLPKTTEVRSVVVTAEDLITKAINEATPAVAQIEVSDSEAKAKNFGLGFLVGDQKTLITNSGTLILNASSTKPKYVATFGNGLVANLELTLNNTTTGVAVLKVQNVEEKRGLLPNPFADSSAKSKPEIASLPFLPLAQVDTGPGKTVISVTGNDSVSVGVISGFAHNASSSPELSLLVKTGAVTGDNLGAPLLSIQGEVVGLSWKPGFAIPASVLKIIIDGIGS